MKRIETALRDVFLIETRVFHDDRGYFFESYNRTELAALGIDTEFIQDNVSCSQRNVLRGLHYQISQTQAKLIRVLHGAIFDVAVDLRRSSPTFGKWIGEHLSAENQRSIFIPEGFAHGFLALTDGVIVHYKVSDSYVPSAERTVIWNDPEIGISWPIAGVQPRLSGKDAQGQLLRDAETLL